MNQALNDLIYKIGGDTSGFDKAMKELDRRAEKSAMEAGGAFARAGDTIAGIGRKMALQFIGPLSVAGVATSMRNVVRETAALADEAARAGLSLRVFQEWKAVAEDTKIPLDAMIDAFKELNIRADEFATTGKGSAAEAFARLGMSPAEIKKRLKDPSDLMQELIRRTKALKDTAAATRIFDEMFGGAGAEQAVRLLGLADGEIRNIIDSAHESGRVLNDEMVKRAAEIDKEFNILWRNFESAAKSAILNVSISLNNGLVRDMNKVGAYAKDLWNDPNIQNLNRFLWGDPNDKRVARAHMNSAGSGNPALEEELRRRFGDEPLTLTVKPPPTTTISGGGSSRSSAADSALREAEAVNKLIEKLTFELELVGKSELEQAKLNARRQAGAAATEDQLAKIDALVESIHKETEAHRAAEKAAEDRKQALDNLFDMAGEGLFSVLEGSVKAEDAIKKLAAQLALAAAQAAFLGTGPLAGLFGGVFGGGGSSGGGVSWLDDLFRESGGPVKKGQPYIVGEKRPELFVPDQDGTIVPYVPEVPNIAVANRGGGISIAYAPVYNVTGSGPEIDRLRADMARDRQQFKGRVIEAVADARRRNVDV